METVVFTVCSMGCLPKTACHSLIRLQDTNVWEKELRDNVQTRKRDEKEEEKEGSNLLVLQQKECPKSEKNLYFMCSEFVTFCVAFDLHESAQKFW